MIERVYHIPKKETVSGAGGDSKAATPISFKCESFEFRNLVLLRYSRREVCVVLVVVIEAWLELGLEFGLEGGLEWR